MPFWLKDPKPIHFIRPLSSSIRLLVSLTSFFSILAIWLLLLHLPADAYKKDSSTSILDLNKQEKMFTQALAQHKKNSEEHTTCHNCFNDTLTNQPGVSNALSKILETIKTKKIACKKFLPHKNKACKFFSKQYFDLDVKTSFKKLYSFFSSFDQFDHCVKFKNITIASKGKNRLSTKTNLRFACFEEKA